MIDAEVRPHPSPFSALVMLTIRGLLPDEILEHGTILDPFAGIGRVHELRDRGCDTLGIELEPEWAVASPYTLVGDSTKLTELVGDHEFDAIVTSPVYGNRMSDHHDAKDASKRITYKHKLGRDLTPGNAGVLQWGQQYREFHSTVWEQCIQVLRPEGYFCLNISSHIRERKVARVADWHVNCLLSLGLSLYAAAPVDTQRMGFGANREARIDYELVAMFRKHA